MPHPRSAFPSTAGLGSHPSHEDSRIDFQIPHVRSLRPPRVLSRSSAPSEDHRDSIDIECATTTVNIEFRINARRLTGIACPHHPGIPRYARSATTGPPDMPSPAEGTRHIADLRPDTQAVVIPRSNGERMHVHLSVRGSIWPARVSSAVAPWAGRRRSGAPIGRGRGRIAAGEVPSRRPGGTPEDRVAVARAGPSSRRSLPLARSTLLSAVAPVRVAEDGPPGEPGAGRALALPLRSPSNPRAGPEQALNRP